MGCGAENPTIKSFRFFEIERHLFEEDDHIVDCVTSANHSVISTNNGFLVAGTSFGQMGAYAQRVYSRRDGKPNSFTRLNAPDDTFSRPHRGFLGASVLDRTTVLFSGSRVKVFVDYEDREFTVTKTAAGAYIVSATACKPQFNQSKLTIAIFMSTCELWLWDKTAGLSLVWRLGKYPASMPMGQHSYAFGANGNFMFVHDETLYDGTIAQREDSPPTKDYGRFKAAVKRTPGSFGSAKRVFMSTDGEKHAALVTRHRCGQSRIDPVERRKRRRQLQTLTAGTEGQAVTFISQTRKSFTVPAFLFTVRGAGNVLRKAATTDYTLQLKKVPDETVEAFVDFIFTGTCELFNTLLGGATDRKCATELEEDEEDVLASKLRRLRTLAADLEYDALHTAADKFLQQLYDADNSDAALVDWSDENLFTNFSIDVTNLFPDGDVLIICSDRRFKFSGEILKLKSAYFETLFRWNEEEQTEVISFEEFPFRLVRLALFFFLTEDLREANLSFEELVEVFFFADRYGLTDFIAQVVDLLEEELVIGRLDDFFELLQSFYAPDLEAVVSEFIYANLVSVLESHSIGHIPQNIMDNVSDRIRSYYASQTDLLNVLPSYKTVDTDSPVLQQFADAAEEVLNELLPILSDAEFAKFCGNPLSFLKVRLRGEAGDRRERKSTCRSSTEKETTADSGILSCAAEAVNDSVNMDETVESHEADEQADDVPAPSEHPSKKGRRKIRYRLFSSDDQAGVNDAHDVSRKISESSNASESSFSLSNRSSNAAWLSSPSAPQSLSKSLREIQLEEEQSLSASASRRSQEPRIPAPQAQSTPVKAERKRFVPTTSAENGPVLSLRQIQEQELAAVAQAKAAEQQLRTAQQASAQREQSHRVSTPVTNEPLRNGHVPSPQPMSLREIQAQEQASLDAAAKARVKPLWALQKEEQAIQELAAYYGQLFTDGTVVSIRRIPPRTT